MLKNSLTLKERTYICRSKHELSKNPTAVDFIVDVDVMFLIVRGWNIFCGMSNIILVSDFR